MPVIPFAQQEQITNPSNPVPIHSPEAAGMQGEAEASFGKALFHLGNVLDAVGNQIETEKKKSLVVSGLAKLQTAAILSKAEQAAAAPIDGDATGIQAFQQFQENFAKRRDEILKNVDPSVADALSAQSEKIVAEHGQEVITQEIKKRASDLKSDQGEAVSNLAALARTDPKMIDYSLTKVSTFVNGSADIADANKPSTERAGHAKVIRDAIAGFADRHDWQAGVALLSKPLEDAQGNILTDKNGVPRTYSESMDPKEKESIITWMHQDEASFHAKENSALEAAERNDNRQAKKVEKDQTSVFYARFADAGSDETKRGPIVDDVNKAVAKGTISLEKARALINFKGISAEQDARFSSQIMLDVTMGRITPDQADEKLDKARGTDITWRGADSLTSKIQTVRRQQSFDGLSGIRKSLNQGTQITMDALTVGLSGADRNKLQEDLEKAHGEAAVLAASNPNMDPGHAVEIVLRNKFGDILPSVPAGSTPESIGEIRKKLASQLTDKSSQSAIDDFVKRDKALKFEQQLLIMGRDADARTRRKIPALGGK